MITDSNKRYYPNAILGGLAAFAVYFCMYAFRKPFAVAKFEGLELWGIDYKVILIISQVAGYAISKFFGIKFISQLRPEHRAFYIIGCIVFTGLSLVGFALVPFPYNFIFMFLNGLPLGLVWGLVFSYLEGRKATELMAAILSSSFIIASGSVKSIGKWLIESHGVSEFWMPISTGLIFFLPMLLFVWILNRTPKPTEEDILLRNVREPMTVEDRKKMFRSLKPGLIVMIFLYMLITAFRDFRDNFSVEVWEDLGVSNKASVFTQSEIPAALCILLLFAMFILIRNNYKAFRSMHFIITAGLLSIGIFNFLFISGIIKSTMVWTILIGIGLYAAYFPFNSMLFDRLIATNRSKGNAGYLIYLADSFGYLGSILVLLFKEFFVGDISYLEFFIYLGYAVSFVGLISFAVTHAYFRKKLTSPALMKL